MAKIYYDFSDRRFSQITETEKKSLKEGDVFICQTINKNDLLDDWIFCVGVVTEFLPLAAGKFRRIAWAIRFAETIAQGGK